MTKKNFTNSAGFSKKFETQALGIRIKLFDDKNRKQKSRVTVSKCILYSIPLSYTNYEVLRRILH
jgi:hypothetical protein